MSLFFEKAWGGPAQMLTLSRRVLGLCAWLSARIQPFSLGKEAACWAIELKLFAIEFSAWLWTQEADGQVH